MPSARRSFTASRSAVALLLGALLVCALAAPQSGAAVTEHQPPVEIVSPGKNALRTGREVTIQLRVRGGLTRPKVTMYGKGRQYRDVSDLLRRTGPGRFAVRLRAGRQLRYGQNSVFVDNRKGSSGGAAEVHFTLARPVRHLLRVRRLERGSVESPPLGLRVRARGAQLRVRLNGHPAGNSFERRGGQWLGSLSAKDGLRFGRNRLNVTAFTSSGRYQRLHRSFVVRGGRPLADAGRDQLTRTGAPLRLSAAATRPGGSAPLRLRWQIVHKPKGSQARLRGASGVHPRLRADVGGNYRLRLRATGIRHGASSSSATTTPTPTAPTTPETTPATPTTPEAAPTAMPSSVDEVEVTAMPDVPPEGTPLQTIVHRQNGETGIEVSGHFYAMEQGAGVQLLALDRTTLKPLVEKSYDHENMNELVAEVQGLNDQNLVILSGGGQGGYPGYEYIEGAIDAIGGITSGPQSLGVLSELQAGNGGWSAIGIPGIPAGQAYQLIGLQQSPETAPGAISGNLQVDSSAEHFAFTWPPEFHPYDTHQTSTPTENVISVDGTAWPSWNLPFPESTVKNGFQLLWLDADTLKLRLSQSAEFNLGAEESEQGKGLWPLRNTLRQILADPKPGLLMINTIGNVETPFYPTKVDGHDGNEIGGNVLARISSLLQEFGANPYVFNTLGAKGIGGAGTPGGYSFVGVTGLRQLKGPNAGAELSTRLVAGAEARLAGVLQRNRQGVLEPGPTGSPGPGGSAAEVQPALLKVLAQPEAQFPSWAQLSPEEQQAQRELAEAKSIRLKVDEKTTGIRANYWQVPSINWDGKAEKLEGVCNTIKCSPAAAALAPILAKEFEEVETVRNYFTSEKAGNIDNVFKSVFNDSTYGLTAVANEIRGAFNPPISPAAGANPLGIFGGTLGIVGGIGDFIPVVGGVISGGAGIAAGITQIVQSSTAESNGEAAFDPYGFHTTLAALAKDLEGSLVQTEHGLSHLADLMVSSPGRLATAAELIETPARDNGWALDTETQSQLQGRLRQTMRQFMWLTMMQPVYATYECVEEDAGGVARHNQEAAMHTLVAYPEWRQRAQPRTFNLYNTYVMLGKRDYRGWPQLPKSSLTKTLFGEPNYSNPSGQGLGFLPEYLMAPSAVSGGPSEAKEKELEKKFEEVTTEEKENHEGEFFRQALNPASPGLLHKNRSMKETWESIEGLSRRAKWSDYTPSCGHAENTLGSSQNNSWAEP
jgi:hypothetical protein